MVAAKAKSTAPVISSLDDYTESINMLVYSDPGAGKTVLAGTAPNATFLATEPGTISAKRMGSQAKLVKVSDWDEFMSWLRWARRGGVKAGEWWMPDTLTELQAMCIKGILSDAHSANASRDLDTPAIQDYMKWQLLFKRVVRAMNDLPCNILYTCHAMDSEDEEGETIVLPSLSGKNGTSDPTTMAKWVAGTVHAYGYLKVKKQEGKEFRRLIFQRSGPYFGKDRYGVLGPYIDNPNMADIEKRILTAPAPVKSTRTRKVATTTENEE
jgi:hypothetical protein